MSVMTPYQSELPVRHDGFAQLLRAEWTKFRTVRGWVIGVTAAALVIVGLGALTGANSECGIQMTAQQQDPESLEYLSKLFAYPFLNFAQHYTNFDTRLRDAENRWDAQLAPYRGRKIVTYHRSWPNFCERFGLQVIDYVEPRPGIPPSPSHTLEVITNMKKQNVKLILYEPYFDSRTPNAIAQAVAGEALQLLPSVGGVKEVNTYFELFDYDIKSLSAALAKYK